MARVKSKIREIRALKWAREGEGYTPRRCAERAGIPIRSWNSYERGDLQPSVATAVRIARALGVTVEDLDFRVDDDDAGPHQGS